MKVLCKYCLEEIDSRGMPAHVHFRHLSYVQREFALNSLIQWYLWAADGREPRFTQLQLPAPNPLTVYSSRPTGKMAAPLPWLRMPKGYRLPYGYARPFEQVAPTYGRIW